MKTILNTLIALFILFLNTESFSNVKNMDDHSTNCLHSYVPVSPRDWTANELEVPENLKFVKAKSALVPVAEFVWGNPDAEAPANLAKDYRTFYVPVPSRTWDDISISADEISELNKI